MKKLIPAILLIAAVVAFRLVPGIPDSLANFSPMAAIVLCAAIYLPRGWNIAVPLVAFLASDLFLNLRLGQPAFTAFTAVLLLSFAVVFFIGRTISHKPRLPLVFGGAVLGSLLFYVITSSASWIASPAYAKTIAGWFQAITIGDPRFAPQAWVFFRNSLAGDLVFTALFVTLCVYLPSRGRLPSAAAASPSDASPARNS